MILLFLALVVDWYIGDPNFIWRKVPHPVVMFGFVIERFDEYRQTKNSDFIFGILLVIMLAAIALAISLILHFIFTPLAIVLEFFIVFCLLAQKSLYEHVEKIFTAENLSQARVEASKIVSREMGEANESEITAAAIESLSENFTDGIVAPIFFYCVFGVGGIIFYKAINTADSMVGYKTKSYKMFGKAAARLDDVLNYLPARLSIIIIASTAHICNFAKFKGVAKCVLQDGGNHASPNAGYPQATFAASLGLRLGGARKYAGKIVSFQPFNFAGRKRLIFADIARALELYRACCLANMAIIFLAIFLF